PPAPAGLFPRRLHRSCTGPPRGSALLTEEPEEGSSCLYIFLLYICPYVIPPYSFLLIYGVWTLSPPLFKKTEPGRGTVSPARQAGLLLVAQRPHHGIHLVVDMLSCDPGCQILVSRGDRLNDRSVFFQKLGIAFLLFQILDPVPVHLLPKIVQKLNEPAVVRRREDHVVERHVRLRDLRNIVAVKDISEM